MLTSFLKSGRSSRLLLVSVCAAVLTLIMTWPLGLHPASVGRVDSGDGRFSIWNVAWVAHALVTAPGTLFDANIFYPHTGTLAYSEANLVAGALAVPAYAMTRDGLLAYNTAVFAAFMLALLTTYALGRRLGLGTSGSAVAAIGFAFSPAVMARSAHIQLMMTVALPAALLGFHAFETRPGWWRAVGLGGALAFAALCCGYYGVYAGLMVGFAALVFGMRKTRNEAMRYWLGLGLALVVAIALVWPVFSYYRVLQGRGFKALPNLVEARLYSADWRAYFASPAHAHAWLLRLIGHWKEVLFPGFIIVILAPIGLREAALRSRRVAICFGGLAALAGWASFGPAAGLYTALAYVLPVMSFLRAPARFGFVVIFALAVLAGFAVDAWVSRPRYRYGAIVLVPALLLEIAVVPWPLPRVAPTPTAYHVVSLLPPGAVIEYPFAYARMNFHDHTIAMFNSMAHWHPMVNGYSDYVPPDFEEIARPLAAFPDAASFQLLQERKVRYVIWRINEYSPTGRAEIERRLSAYATELRPLSKSAEVWLYEIAQWPTAPRLSPR